MVRAQCAATRTAPYVFKAPGVNPLLDHIRKKYNLLEDGKNTFEQRGKINSFVPDWSAAKNLNPVKGESKLQSPLKWREIKSKGEATTSTEFTKIGYSVLHCFLIDKMEKYAVLRKNLDILSVFSSLFSASK